MIPAEKTSKKDDWAFNASSLSENKRYLPQEPSLSDVAWGIKCLEMEAWISLLSQFRGFSSPLF